MSPHTQKLKIAHAVAEVGPYSKYSGLGTVGYALPKAIHRLGQDVIVVSPYYSTVREKAISEEKLESPEPITIDGEEYPVSYRKHVSPDGVMIYFVVNEQLFGSHKRIFRDTEDAALNWIFFSLAFIRLLKLINFQPDIIHVHDNHPALIFNYLATRYKQDAFFDRAAFVYTIHRLDNQGTDLLHQKLPDSKIDTGTGAPPEQKTFRNYINFMKRGILFADVINAVSERYAEEILTPEFGAGLDAYLRRRKDHVFGIINGIDYEVVNPAFDENVYVRYDVHSLQKKSDNKLALQKEVGLTRHPSIPVLGVVNRLTEQKGFELIMEAMPTLLKMDLQMVVVGSGSKDYLRFFRDVARKHPSKVGVYSPFTEKMASRVYAGSDLYLMPSRFEPCGLSQLISLRYGSIPIVRAVGGLKETIVDFNVQDDTGNGFTFDTYTKEELLVTIARACQSYKYPENWKKLVSRAMQESFSWKLPAKKYVELYRVALALKQKATRHAEHH